MTQHNRIEIVKELAKEAGNIALRHFGRITSRKKHDSSLVTEADIEVGEFLTRRLSLNFPHFGIINEEAKNDPDILRKNEYTWIIDPIDGTAGFTNRMPIWAVCIGLMKKTEPVLGVIYLPVLQEIYYADNESPPIFETPRWGRQIMEIQNEAKPMDKESLILTVSYAHRRLQFNFPGKTRSMGSTAAHICFVARGDAMGAVVKGAIWDIAPSWPILKKAGGEGTYMDGTPPDFEEMLKTGLCKDFIIISSKTTLPTLTTKISKKTD